MIKSPSVRTLLLEIFDLVDSNGDGVVGTEEGVQMNRSLGFDEERAMSEWEKMRVQMDTTGSGTVDRDEWLSFNESLFSQMPFDQACPPLQQMRNSLQRASDQRASRAAPPQEATRSAGMGTEPPKPPRRQGRSETAARDHQCPGRPPKPGSTGGC